MAEMKSRIIYNHNTEADWNANDIVPLAGEIIIYDTDNNYPYPRIKVGDGTSKLSNLKFIKKQQVLFNYIDLTNNTNDSITDITTEFNKVLRVNENYVELNIEYNDSGDGVNTFTNTDFIKINDNDTNYYQLTIPNIISKQMILNNIVIFKIIFNGDNFNSENININSINYHNKIYPLYFYDNDSEKEIIPINYQDYLQNKTIYCVWNSGITSEENKKFILFEDREKLITKIFNSDFINHKILSNFEDSVMRNKGYTSHKRIFNGYGDSYTGWLGRLNIILPSHYHPNLIQKTIYSILLDIDVGKDDDENSYIALGYIKGTNFIEGEQVSSTDNEITICEKIIIDSTQTGERTFILENPYHIPSGCSFYLERGSSVQINYRSNGNNSIWMYIDERDSNKNNFGLSNYSAGISLYSSDINLNNRTSFYSGKTLGIIGDSISTFYNKITTNHPTGTAWNVYYGYGTHYSRVVLQDMWWYKIARALGMYIGPINAWAGSKVCDTTTPLLGSTSSNVKWSAEHISGGCTVNRVARFKTNAQTKTILVDSQAKAIPDVIIVWFGINDFSNNGKKGILLTNENSSITYDTVIEIVTSAKNIDNPSISKNDNNDYFGGTHSFTKAYSLMLNGLLKTYPKAEIWICTLPEKESVDEDDDKTLTDETFPETNAQGNSIPEYNKVIRYLADIFGVKVLEHGQCGLTWFQRNQYYDDSYDKIYGLHPNAFGHSIIANNDIFQMDPGIKKRYY